MASRQRSCLLIGAFALVVTLPPPSLAQTPRAPSSITRCTEAAPCAAPRPRKTPGRKPPSAAAVRQFRETHPCPTTAHNWGDCPGYVVTHITPPCKGGTDAPDNLQWLTHARANRLDQTACRRPRTAPKEIR
jgi:hypothetical protein